MGRVPERLESWWVRKPQERAAGWGGVGAGLPAGCDQAAGRRGGRSPEPTATGKTAAVELGRNGERKESESAAAPLLMPCDPAGASPRVGTLQSRLPPPLGGSGSRTDSIFSGPVSASCAPRFRESLGRGPRGRTQHAGGAQL